MFVAVLIEARSKEQGLEGESAIFILRLVPLTLVHLARPEWFNCPSLHLQSADRQVPAGTISLPFYSAPAAAAATNAS